MLCTYKTLNVFWKERGMLPPSKDIWKIEHFEIANTILLLGKRHHMSLRGYKCDILNTLIGELGILEIIIQFAVDWRNPI